MPGPPENPPKEPSAPSVASWNPPQSATAKGTPQTREQFVTAALEEHESPLIGYATSILHDLDAARDVVQDTFTRLCQQDPAAVRANLKPWLFTVCRNRALDVLRKEKRVQPLEEIRWQKVAGPGLQPDETLHEQERNARLMGCLDRLTENQREVILLKFQHQLSYREIQEITGLRSGNIGFLIHTGLKRLREILPADLRD